MDRREYEEKLKKWEAEGYDVSELRKRWFPAKIEKARSGGRGWLFGFTLVAVAVIAVFVGIQLGKTGQTEKPVTSTATPKPVAITPATTPQTATPRPSPITTTTTTSKTTPTMTPTTIDSDSRYGGTLNYIYAYSPGNNIGWPLETNTQNIWGTNFVFAEPLVY